MPAGKDANNPERWLKTLVGRVAQTPETLKKTVFLLASMDRQTGKPIDSKRLAAQLRLVQQNGVRNFGYYPDLAPQGPSGALSHQTCHNPENEPGATAMIEVLSYHAVKLIKLVFGFTYYYPLFMAYLWMLGALLFYLRYEFRKPDFPILKSWPKVSIIVPCYNEEEHVREGIEHLMGMRYPDYEIIAVNDGSSDHTGVILDELAQNNNKLRVIHHAKNQGKAVGLNTAAYLARSEYIIGIDSDALLTTTSSPGLSNILNRTRTWALLRVIRVSAHDLRCLAACRWVNFLPSWVSSSAHRRSFTSNCSQPPG